jgi:Ni/Co efflux regulator RcnB
MKILTLIAAAAAAMLAVPAASAATAAAPSAITAAAFAASSATKMVVQDGRRYDRDDRRRGYDRRHRRVVWRTVCTRKWRNGHRVRTCRKVRYYR